MILYHLDRNKTLKEGMQLNLQPIYQMITDNSDSSFLSIFKSGVSEHGVHYLCPQCTPMNMIMTPTCGLLDISSFELNKSELDSRIIEFTFEMVRQVKFRDFPSRFVSIFAVNDIDELKKWPELSHISTDIESSIYEIEVPDDTPHFDSQYLRGGIMSGIDNGKYYMGMRIDFLYDFALYYWNGDKTDNPKDEYLIPLPVTIGKKVQI